MNDHPHLRLVHSRAEPRERKPARSGLLSGEIILYFAPSWFKLEPRKPRKPRVAREGHAPGWPGRFRPGSGFLLDPAGVRAALVRVEGWFALYRFERDGRVYRIPRDQMKVIDKDTIAVTREWLAHASPSGWQ